MKENSVYLCSCEVPEEFGRVRHVKLTNIENVTHALDAGMLPLIDIRMRDLQEAFENNAYSRKIFHST